MEFMANSCPLLDFFVHLVERVRWVSGLIISVIIGNIIFAIFTFFFAFGIYNYNYSLIFDLDLMIVRTRFFSLLVKSGSGVSYDIK
jgi:hypothetical protein